MNRFLIFCFLIAAGFAAFFKLESDNRLKRAVNAENRASALETHVSELEAAMKEKDKLIEVYAEAEKQSKEFEKELNHDTTDNLDVVPTNYILKQLQSD